VIALRFGLIAAVVALAVWRRVRRARRARHVEAQATDPLPLRTRRLPLPNGPVWLVAEREVTQRLRSRVFKVATAIMLLVVVAGVVIPVLRKGKHQRSMIGIVGSLSAPEEATVIGLGAVTGTPVSLVPQPDLATAEVALRAGHLALAIVDGRRIVVKVGLNATDTSTTALLARAISGQLGLQNGLQAAGIPADQAARLAHPTPLPISSLQPPKGSQTARITAVYGLIIMYVLLTQYGTWILMGVVEEKANRVVEVLLSSVRAGELLTGKIIGIGGVALGQGLLLVGVSLGLAKAVGSPLVKGTAPVLVATILLWLVLGYAFYCWVYAAGGSLADRQEHVQTLAFPLQLPLLAGYIISLTSLGSTNPSTFVRVLAYLPPTAPFGMSVLVADNKVTWLGFTASALLTIAATIGVARFATMVYRRAILQTGRRVSLRRVLTEAGD
jgi:ABC-2 type transport system permease protein